MTLELEKYLAEKTSLQVESLSNKASKKIRISLPSLPRGREIFCAWLDLPHGFPSSASARIQLSPECILKIPHVESDGMLCIESGDPGPTSGVSIADRLDQVLDAFFHDFLTPWVNGDLDNHFAKEAMNYWGIHCIQHRSQQAAIAKVYITDRDRSQVQVYKTVFLVDQRSVIAGKDTSFQKRFIESINTSEQVRKVLVAIIPISSPLTPDNWSKSEQELLHLLSFRLNEKEYQKFVDGKNYRNRSVYRLVIFRSPDCDFSFLLSGGPSRIVKKGYSVKSFPNYKMIPVKVDRVDSSWTTGRDQHPEVAVRQNKSVLVIGAGALGSSVIEQLAKAGIGHITIIDSDILSPANLGRHTLGADSIGQNKAQALSKSIKLRWPSCNVKDCPYDLSKWLLKNDFSNIDIVLDLTGEPDVRMSVEYARQMEEADLVIGWMEPYVVAAHACVLPIGNYWLLDSTDQLESLQSVDWPPEVMLNEPSCSSVFQSYTSSAATYAVGLVTGAALDLIDGKIGKPIVRHWVRGQSYLDKNYTGLKLRKWAESASKIDGTLIETHYGS